MSAAPVYAYPILLKYPTGEVGSSVTLAQSGGEVTFTSNPVVKSYVVEGKGWSVDNGFGLLQNGLRYHLESIHLHVPAEHKIPRDTSKRGGGGGDKEERKESKIPLRSIPRGPSAQRDAIEIHFLFVANSTTPSTPRNEVLICYVADLVRSIDDGGCSSSLFRRLAQTLETPPAVPSPKLILPDFAPYWSYAGQVPPPSTPNTASIFNISSNVLSITPEDLKTLSTHTFATHPTAPRRGRPVVFFCQEPVVLSDDNIKTLHSRPRTRTRSRATPPLPSSRVVVGSRTRARTQSRRKHVASNKGTAATEVATHRRHRRHTKK